MHIRKLTRAWKFQCKRLRNERRYRGEGVVCPCCGGSFRAFMPRGSRTNATCPRCSSHERHRLIALYLQRETRFLTDPVRILHFAPERSLERVLRANPQASYLSGDLDGSRAMRAIDVTNIQTPDHAFDLILCSHVLEHVPDDRKAMRELHRVLAPGGMAVLLVPIDRSRPTTDEDPTITDPAERIRRFGQHDHVRQYGMDYYDRLREAGFEVHSIAYAEAIDPAMRARYGLQRDETMDLGVKTAEQTPVT